MIHSEHIGELAAALAGFQLECPPIPKNKEGKIKGQSAKGAYEYSYKYADLVDVMKIAAPIAAKHGLSVTQGPETGAHLTTLLMHKSDQWVEWTMDLLLVKADPQGQGSGITYGRRYAYCAALGIVADEDDDGRVATEPRSRSTAPPQTTRRPPPQNGAGITEPQKRNVVRLLHKLDVPEEMWRSFVAQELGLPEPVSSSALTKAQAGALITKLKAEAGEADTPAYSHQGAADDERPFE